MLHQQNKAVSRLYHTYFQWDKKNANSFFGLFGEPFLAACKERVRSDSELEGAIRAFLELGNARNEMVHENFALFSMNKTAEEVFALYSRARAFVDFLENSLHKASPKATDGEGSGAAPFTSSPPDSDLP
jgi:hypothetical protein